LEASNYDLDQLGVNLRNKCYFSFLLFYSLAFGIAVSNLAAFHLYLVFRNVTTSEEINGSFSGTGNPYSLGWYLNLRSFWCGQKEKSLLTGFVEKSPAPKNVAEFNQSQIRRIRNAQIPLDAEY